jgi:cytidylate kinase
LIKYPVIAIDGPSGSGKGTLSRGLAVELKWHWLDSGAVYRCLALAALERDLDESQQEAVVALADKLEIKFNKINELQNYAETLMDARDVTEAIRDENCGQLASRLAAVPAVRTALLDLQRRFRQPPGLVADGRDMGTVVFPDAELKIFLEASAQERAERRYKQLKQKGIDVSLTHLAQDLEERDRRDRERSVAPLKPAPDAHIVDSTRMDIPAVIQHVLTLVQSRLVPTMN